MKMILKTLIYLFFAGFVIPSFFNFFTAWNENVNKGEMPIKELAAQTPEYSYLPVRDFYLELYEKYIPQEKTE